MVTEGANVDEFVVVLGVKVELGLSEDVFRDVPDEVVVDDSVLVPEAKVCLFGQTHETKLGGLDLPNRYEGSL